MAIFEYDQRLVDDLISRFGLRLPNAKGLDAVVHALSRQDECEQVVLDIATGVGKTHGSSLRSWSTQQHRGSGTSL